jgi:hypothetical protein
MAGCTAGRAIITLQIAALFALASCGSNSGFRGKSERKGDEIAAAKVGDTQSKSSPQADTSAESIQRAEDALPETTAPSSNPNVAAITPNTTPAPSPVPSPAVTPAPPPPRAAEIFFHQGPAEDTIELYVNGVKDGQARSGLNTLRIVVKAEGEVHFWSFKAVVKGVEILANARERWIDGTIPLGTILYDQTVSFNY